MSLAYGAIRAGSGDIPTDYQFTGQRRDFSSNLYQMGVRWYDPLVGRFLSPDTIVPRPENPQTLNRYSYTANNPLKYIDPSGHDLVIVFGRGCWNDYNNPSSWKQYIVEYKGWTEAQWQGWLESWKSADELGRIELARREGVMIFHGGGETETNSLWNSPHNASLLQNAIDAAQLKDVTIVAASRGGHEVTTLLKEYQEGTIPRGQVKNVVLFDPPQGAFFDALLSGPYGNTEGVDAAKTRVKVVTIVGPVACLGMSTCYSLIENDTEFRIVDSHNLPNDLADDVYRYLDIYDDWNARPDPRWDDEEGWY